MWLFLVNVHEDYLLMNNCCLDRYYSSRFTDVVCRLNVFPADMALKDEQRQLSTLQQRAFAFDRTHPFTASLSPYFQLLRQRLAVKLQQRRRAAAAMKCVPLVDRLCFDFAHVFCRKRFCPPVSSVAPVLNPDCLLYVQAQQADSNRSASTQLADNTYFTGKKQIWVHVSCCVGRATRVCTGRLWGVTAPTTSSQPTP